MTPRINEEMTFQEILKMDPAVAKVLAGYNMACAGCGGARHERLRQGALAHGVDIKELLRDLNAIFESQK